MLDFDTYMPGDVLAKVDRMSMRHGLEVRTPYLYEPLYALSRQASLADFFGPSGQKAVLRKLLGKYIGGPHITAPKKGFGMPLSVFLNNKQRVAAELQKAQAILADTAFFKDRKDSAKAFAAWGGNNMNAAWATIVLGKWIESVGSGL